MGVGSEGERYYKELVDVLMEASRGFLDDLTGGTYLLTGMLRLLTVEMNLNTYAHLYKIRILLRCTVT